MLETIPNMYPHLTMRVTLTYPFTGLCPISGEPQPSSTITISYEAGPCLLETKALRRYLESFAGENDYGVRDLEEAVQVIAQECANALVVQVVVHAHYELSAGSMDVEVTAIPSG
jgi:NADPH-dependent 7-cyano-7-deazaguanine reductase QueF